MNVGDGAVPADDLTFRGTVYPWQVDHMGHMNVQHYVAFFDQATWVLFASVGMTADYWTAENRGMAAVEQHLRYRREVFAGAVVTVRTRILEVSTRSVRFRHVMQEAEEIVATCELVGVHMDRSRRRAVAFPDTVSDALRGRAMPEEP